MHEVELQLGIMGVVIYALRWAQKSALFPWLRLDTDKVRMGLSAAFAFVTSLGFVFSFDGYTVIEGGKIVIAVPAMATLLNAIGHSSLGFMGQELGHTLLRVRDSQTTIAGLLMNLQKTGWLDPDGPKFKPTADLVPAAPKETSEPLKAAAIVSDTRKDVDHGPVV